MSKDLFGNTNYDVANTDADIPAYLAEHGAKSYSEIVDGMYGLAPKASGDIASQQKRMSNRLKVDEAVTRLRVAGTILFDPKSRTFYVRSNPPQS